MIMECKVNLASERKLAQLESSCHQRRLSVVLVLRLAPLLATWVALTSHGIVPLSLACVGTRLKRISNTFSQ